MANVLVDKQSLTDIATAIRSKNGSAATYKPSEMANAITNISGGGGTLNFQEKNVTPSTSSQTITPDAGYNGLNKVVVGAVTSSIDSDIVAGNIKKGVNILGVTGTLETTSEPNLQSKNATPTTSAQTITPDSGYDGLGQVTISAVTSSIDANIKANNIKSGVSILGITGTYDNQKEEQTKSVTITENGTTTITPDSNKVLSSVSVTTNIQTGITPTGTKEITANGTYDVTNYASASVNVASSGGGSGIKFATGTFTISEDAAQYSFTGLGFQPKLIIVKGDIGTASVARTAYWVKNAITGESITCCHKSTNASITTVTGTNYATFDSDGFTVKQYLTNPLVAGTYSYIALSDE